MKLRELHIEMWNWISENPGKNKQEWGGWKVNGGTQKELPNDCFDCLYDERHTLGRDERGACWDWTLTNVFHNPQTNKQLKRQRWPT